MPSPHFSIHSDGIALCLEVVVEDVVVGLVVVGLHRKRHKLAVLAIPSPPAQPVVLARNSKGPLVVRPRRLGVSLALVLVAGQGP